MRPKAENRAGFAPVEIYLGISMEYWPVHHAVFASETSLCDSLSHTDKSLRQHRTSPAHALLPRRMLTMAKHHPPPNQGLISNPPRLILLPSVAAIVSDVPICEAILQAVSAAGAHLSRSDEAIVGSL